jgi:hypothetical protein
MRRDINAYSPTIDGDHGESIPSSVKIRRKRHNPTFTGPIKQLDRAPAAYACPGRAEQALRPAVGRRQQPRPLCFIESSDNSLAIPQDT